MDGFAVDIVIKQKLLRFHVWSVETHNGIGWHATMMRRAEDGSFAVYLGQFFSHAATPHDAIGRAVSYFLVHWLTAVLPDVVPATSSFEGDRSAVPGIELVQDKAADASTLAPVELTPVTSRADRAATLSGTIDGAIERLAQQLAEGHTQEFLAMLSFYGRFWKYSVGNMLLIQAQCPTASRVAGMRAWNELGYTVKKGERALWIWCPLLRKEVDPTTGDTLELVTGFRPGPVFDASQLKEIEEKPLPDLFTPLPDDVQELYRTVKQRIEAEGIVVAEQLLPAGVQGASQGGRILVRPDIDSRNKLFVLLHELAHELAHHQQDRDQKTTGQRELEAESTAFVVASVLGLDIPTSRDYLLSWHGTAEELRASLSTIQQLVRQILVFVGPDKSATPVAA